MYNDFKPIKRELNQEEQADKTKAQCRFQSIVEGRLLEYSCYCSTDIPQKADPALIVPESI